jgi:exonuclease VII large subunit
MNLKNTKENLKPIFSSLKNLKTELNSYIKHRDYKALKDLLKENLQDVQGDMNSFFDKEVAQFRKKFKKEKETLEHMVNDLIQKEINKAKDFINDQKRELDSLQKKLEGHLKASLKEEKPVAKAKKKTVKKTTKTSKVLATKKRKAKVTRKA